MLSLICSWYRCTKHLCQLSPTSFLDTNRNLCTFELLLTGLSQFFSEDPLWRRWNYDDSFSDACTSRLSPVPSFSLFSFPPSPSLLIVASRSVHWLAACLLSLLHILEPLHSVRDYFMAESFWISRSFQHSFVLLHNLGLSVFFQVWTAAKESSESFIC